VDREVVDALLGLLDERVDEQVDRQLARIAADLLEALVDRHGADRHRRVAHDPLAGLVDVLARRQVHHGVRAPLAVAQRSLSTSSLDRRATALLPMLALILVRKAADDHRLESRGA
jgi:hypothetical protein